MRCNADTTRHLRYMTLRQKADVNTRDTKGWRPLHYAAQGVHDKTSKVLF